MPRPQESRAGETVPIRWGWKRSGSPGSPLGPGSESRHLPSPEPAPRPPPGLWPPARAPTWLFSTSASPSARWFWSATSLQYCSGGGGRARGSGGGERQGPKGSESPGEQGKSPPARGGDSQGDGSAGERGLGAQPDPAQPVPDGSRRAQGKATRSASFPPDPGAQGQRLTVCFLSGSHRGHGARSYPVTHSAALRTPVPPPSWAHRGAGPPPRTHTRKLRAMDPASHLRGKAGVP